MSIICFNTGAGVYLGFSKSEKYRVWVPTLNEDRLQDIEKSTNSAEELAKALLSEIFKNELLEPDKYCCSKSTNRITLNPQYLNGIRCKLSMIVNKITFNINFVLYIIV